MLRCLLLAGGAGAVWDFLYLANDFYRLLPVMGCRKAEVMCASATKMPPTNDPASISHPHDSLSGEVIAIVTVFQAFSTLALVLRLWTRLKIQRLHIGADNLTIIVAWALSVALDVLIAIRNCSLTVSMARIKN